MARLLAIEWDSREARVAVASPRAGGMTVESLFAVPLEAAAGESGEEGPEKKFGPVQMGQAIAAALASQRVAPGPALVALGRGSVELQVLTLPPTPDAELPEMVRFQAVREFTSLGEDWPLDYVPLNDDAAEQRIVVAATVSPAVIKDVRTLCQAAGLEPERLLLRPAAAAAALLKSPEIAESRIRLLIDVPPGEANLTVTVGERVVFARTARTGKDVLASAEAARPFIGEVRRTLAAVHSQLGEDRVEFVYLIGDTPAHQTLAKTLADELELPAKAIDPLAGVELARRLRKEPPAHPERYLALVGALHQEAVKESPAIDFFHVRKAPPPPSQRRKYSMFGLAAGVAVALLGATFWFQIHTRNKEIDALKSDISALNADVAQADADQEELSELESWTATDFNWLNVLEVFSTRFPGPGEAMVTRLTLRSSDNDQTPHGGSIQFDGLAADEAAYAEIDKKLRKEEFESGGKTVSIRKDDENYELTFTGAEVNLPRQPPDYTPAEFPEEAAAGSEDSATEETAAAEQKAESSRQ